MLEHHGACLPSFAALPAAQQRSVRFTQSKMGFNHGWLVQAEAPPGALFSSFKKLIDDEGVDSADIAFYFVHWLTDLAGAVPTPLEGSTQFAVRFPQPVLASFLRSIPLVQRLATKSETELFEAFLVEWWPNDKLGPPPEGDDAIALMRLMVQVQTPEDQRKLREAYGRLPSESRVTLAREMALTAVDGQVYQRTPCWGSAGPALLVYYSPALLRGCHDEPLAALQILAEVYAAARTMFPTVAGAAGHHATVLVDQLKALKTVGAILKVYEKGTCWVLMRTGSSEAAVEAHPLPALGEILRATADHGGPAAIVLPLWSAAPLLSSQRVPGLSPEGSFAKRRGRRLSVAVS